MFSETKRTARTMVTALAAAAAFTMTVPTGTAFAINEVSCAEQGDFLRIQSHHSTGLKSEDCYANAGKTDFGGWWIDKISTGNNDVRLHDANGSVVNIPRHRVVTYPNRPPKVNAIEIL
ncbi:beta/gamma crystallin domain-containing protein [Streptomyces sp. UH6]|uniref:beta/gamma crystallin domain-containing protein n=1 Tax=Streptomyces sp. UH6 TaxID=2748379 RepID=UPI0015D51A5A|nr:beta/gamma crystallin domain-containing protein [Streptomyces sp. UH6]NYV75554.1 oxidoreductase [Streptomyces sp. UH6]